MIEKVCEEQDLRQLSINCAILHEILDKDLYGTLDDKIWDRAANDLKKQGRFDLY